LVLDGEGAGLAGEQFHMIFAHIQDVIGGSGGFFYAVDSGLQVGDVDL